MGVEGPEEAEYRRLLAERDLSEVRLRAEQRALRESEERILRHIAESRAGDATPVSEVDGRHAASWSEIRRQGFALPVETPAPMRLREPETGERGVREPSPGA